MSARVGKQLSSFATPFVQSKKRLLDGPFTEEETLSISSSGSSGPTRMEPRLCNSFESLSLLGYGSEESLFIDPDGEVVVCDDRSATADLEARLAEMCVGRS